MSGEWERGRENSTEIADADLEAGHEAALRETAIHSVLCSDH